MVFKSFQEMRTALIDRLKENELKDRLLEFKRSKLVSLMIRAIGKRRHSETKEQMADLILRFTSEQTVKRIIGTTTA